MIQTNSNKRPVFSLVWLAGIILVGTVSADEPLRFSPESPTIVSRGVKNSNPQIDSSVVDFAEITEGIRIANLNPYSKASGPGKDEVRLPFADAAGDEQPAALDASKPSVQQPIPPAAASPLFRAISSINLADAGRSESLLGEPLKMPGSQAESLLSEHGTWQDISGYRATPLPRHNYYTFAHNPLYFEDPNLERLGQGDGCFTDVVSAAHFFGRMPILPYMIGSNGPHTCVPSLGNYSPCCRYKLQDCVPPLNAEGVALQAACTVGLIFLIP